MADPFQTMNSGNRPQTVLTPPEIYLRLHVLWGGIAFDPCAPEGLNPVNAALAYDGTDGRDGLGVVWPPYTYSNPPYGTDTHGRGALRRWMAHAAEHGSGDEIAMLIPVRTHRIWWRASAGRIADRICWLDPVKFQGYKQSFPAPLVLTYRGALTREFRILFSALGDVTENPFAPF